MTKRERLYHGLVKAGKLNLYKMSTLKSSSVKNCKKPTGICIDIGNYKGAFG